MGGQMEGDDLGQEQFDQEGQDPNQYQLDPNAQVNDDFLGGQQQYEMDDGEPVNQNGMFGQRNEQEEQEPENEDEYFDDAGDIGYLPADHVSKNPLTNFRYSP